MTVIEVSLSRQRPGLVSQETDSPGAAASATAVGRAALALYQSRKPTEAGDGMQTPTIMHTFGEFLRQSAGGLIGEQAPAPDSRHLAPLPLRSDGSLSKRQKISSRIDLPQVRGRRKSRWKLKFHHQALPPEYLRHYKQQERKRRQSETKKCNLLKNKVRKIVRKFDADEARTSAVRDGLNDDDAERLKRKEEVTIKEEDADEEKEEEKQQLQRQQEDEDERGLDAQMKAAQELLHTNVPQLSIDITQNKAFLENLLTNQIEINRVEAKERREPTSRLTTSLTSTTSTAASTRKSSSDGDKGKVQPIPSSGKIMNVSDLPYMGEITLDGIKPRRGRKPKKADICHLIYKNYGQVFPGSPRGRSPEGGNPAKKQVKWKSDIGNGWNQMNSSQSSSSLVSTKVGDGQRADPSGLINHSEVQNRIINSLLEKRLTQESKKVRDEGEETRSEEPLNLCIRDLQSLKIKLSRKHGNVYETSKTEKEVIRLDNSESEKGTTDGEDEDDGFEEEDLAPFNLVTTELRESSDEDNFLNFNDQITLTKVKEEKPATPSNSLWSTTPPAMLPLYYQKPAASLLPSPKTRPEHGDRKRPATLKSATPSHVITKRKRSAIFIPPVPAENTTNPTTEVSICKFKFTGGAKPSLQEKKMLSVDSGGNFRYYSGTGDKSMRGYEYFPRESLQQCQENTGCSPSGVFLTASALGSGEKIPEEIGHSGFFDSDFPVVPAKPAVEVKPRTKHGSSRKTTDDGNRYRTLREHLTDVVLVPDVTSSASSDDDDEVSQDDFRAMMRHHGYCDGLRGNDVVPTTKKSRKSKKSLAREKLEQTFKEKGFLIQTQQLESAEGATYCKFRQLRKFTRYLFRSWKDYLPGNVRDLSVDAGVDGSKAVDLATETELVKASASAEVFETSQGKNM